jgi:signal transduction histidine kinase
MYLTLYDKKLYMKELSAQQHNKIAAELEKNQLQDMIGNITHDLKTPLQAFMSELSSVQTEMNVILMQLLDLRSIASSNDDCTKNELSKRVLASVDELTFDVGEINKYLESLQDIYTFMIMAINRAIEFRKTASDSCPFMKHLTYPTVFSGQLHSLRVAPQVRKCQCRVTPTAPRCVRQSYQTSIGFMKTLYA